MRSLIAVLMLAVSVAPVRAEWNGINYSGIGTVRLLDLDYRGNRGFVQEYDGRQYDGGEADLSFKADKSNAYLDFNVNGLNSANEEGFLNLNIGSLLELTGKLNIMTHRQPFAMTGLYVDGVYTDSTRITDLTGGVNMGFRRWEDEFKVAFACPNNPDYRLFAKVWEERESGNSPARYTSSGGATSNKVSIGDIDRMTRDVTVGAQGSLGENGAVAYDFTIRNFEDSISSQTAVFTVRPIVAHQKMTLHDVRFRYNLASVAMTGSLSGRSRKNDSTGYIANAYAASLAGAYKPTRKSSITAKFYGRTVGINENASYIDTSGKTWGNGLDGQIDRYNVRGEINGRYDFSHKLRAKVGYKLENNLRRHADLAEEVFTKDATYLDGTYISSNTQSNAVAVQDTRHIVTAGVDADLPFDASLGLNYKKLMANRAVFESMPTDSDEIDLSFNVPLPANLTFLASVGYLAEQNKKSNLTNSKRQQNSYLAGVDWSNGGPVSAGVDYSYEQASYFSTGYFGASNAITYLTPNRWVTALMRFPGMNNKYENNVFGGHAAVRLPKGFSVTGYGSYTKSLSITPVGNFTEGFLVTDAGKIVNSLMPSDIRIVRGSVYLRYQPAKYDNLAARLGYRRDQWVDKVDSRNSGWVNIAELMVSAKF